MKKHEKMEGIVMPDTGEDKKIADLRQRAGRLGVLNLSFSDSSPGRREIDYMQNALDILEKNNDWIEENARIKAAKIK